MNFKKKSKSGFEPVAKISFITTCQEISTLPIYHCNKNVILFLNEAFFRVDIVYFCWSQY